MKNKCLKCGKEFSGRTDKRFCSLECKNSYHNTQRRQEYVNIVNAALQRNRLLLQKLLFNAQSTRIIERKLLEDLHFRFDLITGYSRSSEGRVIHKVYEYNWIELLDDQISITLELEPINNDLP